MRQTRSRAAELCLAAFAALTVLPATAIPGRAAEAIELSIDIAHVLRLERPAGTVIIGNPNIADATVLDARTFVLTGKSAGLTNLIVLDRDGTDVSDFAVRVTNRNGNYVSVRAGERQRTFFCDGICENLPSRAPKQKTLSPDVASMPAAAEDAQPAIEGAQPAIEGAQPATEEARADAAATAPTSR